MGKLDTFKITISKSDVVSYSAIFTAFLALMVSIYEGYEIRKHNRLSVRPHLQNAVERTGRIYYSIGLKNGGLGPAIIEDFQILANGKEMEFWKDAMDEIELSKFSSLSTLKIGDVINSGEVVNLVVLDTFLLDFGLRYNIKFSSLYGEEFAISYSF